MEYAQNQDLTTRQQELEEYQTEVGGEMIGHKELGKNKSQLSDFVLACVDRHPIEHHSMVFPWRSEVELSFRSCGDKDFIYVHMCVN